MFFFFCLTCCIELRTSCGGCTLRLRQTTCMRHLQPSRRTEQRLQTRRRRRRPRVCCAGPCDGCPATAPSGSASGSASSTPVRGSAASSTASFHQASRHHHLVPVSWNGNPSEVLVVLQLLEDTSNNLLVSSAHSFLSLVSLFCLNLCLWL